jgi:hypothetical protein
MPFVYKSLIHWIVIGTTVACLPGLLSCSSKRKEVNDEQIRIQSQSDTSQTKENPITSVNNNVTMKDVASFPNQVILTGLNQYRLVSIYQSIEAANAQRTSSDNDDSYSYKSNDGEDEHNAHFMPGIDILYGYKLLNIAHYDLKSEKMGFLFNHPVLVKTLYYPAFEQDSLDNQPITRDYYLVSVYDEDTNKDNLINKKDLRKFYHFSADGTQRTQLIPAGYSVLRSQYDSKNDLMYLFARFDENKNGTEDKAEPIYIFWFSLKTPAKAKLLYQNQ